MDERLVAATVAAAFSTFMGTAMGLSIPAKPDLSVAGPAGSTIRLEMSDRIRGEFVDWFDAGPAANARYDFFANRFQAGLRIVRSPFEVFIQYQNSALGSVPAGGAPGPGGAYFANTRSATQEGSWPRQVWIKFARDLGPYHAALKVGRLLYKDGMETRPRNATLARLKKFRVGQRLIGPFDYTHAGRSFDGVVVAADHGIANVTGFAMRPTYGGFEVNAGRHISGIDLAGLSATFTDRPGFDRTEARIFWIYYADDRAGDRDIVVLDNRSPTIRAADHGEILIHTIGADFLRVEPIGPGQADLLAWAAGQFGNWQSLSHQAWGYALEAGYQMPQWAAKPWVRAGLWRSSGDPNPTDSDHETFYQIIPTARIYAQTPFYNLMNNQDVFAQLLLSPLARLAVRTDFHWLRTSEGRDFLYFGGGATKDTFFGYGGVPARGRRDIGFLTDVGITYRPLDFLKVYAYYAHVFGGRLMRASFADADANYGYLEVTTSF